jgi:hypothetical protein
MAKATKSERRKRIALAALGGVFVFAVIYNLFLSPPTVKSPRKSGNSNAPASATPTAAVTPSSGPAAPAAPKATGQPEEVVAIMMQDLTPLDLRGPGGSNTVELDKERGDVFKPYVEPPKPQPPPPPPPPITLTGISPASAVAGTPRKFTLTIVGSMIPQDAQLLFDGSVKPARRLNEHQMAADIEPSEYAYPRSINITVKSASEPAKWYSTAANFAVQPAPEPQFRYIGRLGELAILELSATKEIKRLGRGDTVMGQWRIDAINDQAIEVTLTAYDIKKRVPLTEKTR